jgi:predicted RNase H-like nuclease (RuvC/YqgF family)
LRIRTEPSLNGEIVGHVEIGYYNVLSQKEADGYIWYQIAENRWCANVGVNYLPTQNDVIKEIERLFNNLKREVDSLQDENSTLKNKLKEIERIAKI